MISDLNGFQLTGAAREGGISRVEIAYDPTKIQRIRSGSEKVTQKVLTRVQEVSENRPVAQVPAYVPAEPRELTLRYAGSAAIGGWVCAVALDCLPLLFFLLLLLTARQHLMNRYRQPERPSPHPDYDFHARQVAAQQAR